MNARVDRRQWLLLLGAVSLLIVVLMVRHRIVPRTSARERLAALGSELERLRGCDDLRVRSERQALDRRRMTGPIAIALPGWRSIDPDGLRWTVTDDRWPEIFAALTAIETAPLQHLEIRTRGSLTQREIASVEAALMRPAATPPRPEAGAASAARTEAKEAEAGAAPLAARAGSRPQNSESLNQP